MNHQFSEASYWLRCCELLGAAPGELAIWQARIARKKLDFVTMQQALDKAKAAGAAAEIIERQRVLASVLRGHFAEHESQLQQLMIEVTPSDPDICDAFANGLASQGRFDQCLLLLQAWQEDHPDDPMPHLRRAQILEHLANIKQAEVSYRRAVDTAPNFAPGLFGLARFLLLDNQPDAALPLFLAAAASSPETACASMIGASKCSRLMGKMDQARRLLSKPVETSNREIERAFSRLESRSNSLSADYEMGMLEAESGNWEESLVWMDKAAARKPKDLDVQFQRALALRKLGRIDEAKELFEHVASVRDKLKAADVLRDRVMKNPGDVEARFELGVLHLQYVSQESGLFWLRSILVHDPDHIATHRELERYFQSMADANPMYREKTEHHKRAAAQALKRAESK